MVEHKTKEWWHSWTLIKLTIAVYKVRMTSFFFHKVIDASFHVTYLSLSFWFVSAFGQWLPRFFGNEYKWYWENWPLASINCHYWSWDRHQVIICTNPDLLSIETRGTNFCEISIKIHFHLRKIILKRSPPKWRPIFLATMCIYGNFPEASRSLN